MDHTFMKTRKIVPLVISMSLPMFISMLVSALYNIVDSYFVAKISEDAMTAVSLVYPIQNLNTAVGVGFGVGVNSAVSYFLGAEDRAKAESCAHLGLYCSILHGALLTIFGIAIMPWFLSLYTENRVILQSGLDYSRIVFAVSIPYCICIHYEKLYQAVGKMKVTMWSLGGGCLLNVLLDPLLIFGIGPFPKMGVRGAALATAISMLLPLAIYLILYARGSLGIRVSFRKTSPLNRPEKRKLLKRLYAVGVPATLNMALPSVQVTVLNGILAGISATYVFILGVYYKLQTFMYSSTNGIVQGIRPLVGYNYGAKEYKRVLGVFRTALLMALIIMAVGLLLCQTIPGTIMGWFTDNPDTIAKGALALRLISIGFLPSAFSVTVSGTLEGMGNGTGSLVTSLLRYIVVILPLAFLLSHFYGASGVWNSFWITELASAAAAGFLFHRERKKLIAFSHVK